MTTPDQSTVADAVVAELRHSLEGGHEKIVHCLKQLNDDQLNWRPFENQNSIANIILHLCGNVRQWIINAVPAAPDTRNRPAEFSDRARYTRDDLLDRLEQAVREAADTIAGSSEQLLEQRRIQGFEMTILAAISHSVAHFHGHTQEIIYITRYQLRDVYQFSFVPQTKEQGAP